MIRDGQFLANTFIPVHTAEQLQEQIKVPSLASGPLGLTIDLLFKGQTHVGLTIRFFVTPPGFYTLSLHVPFCVASFYLVTTLSL